MLSPRFELEVWLPDDGESAVGPLSLQLSALGVPVRKESLPVLRRRNLNPAGVIRLLRSAASTFTRRQASSGLHRRPAEVDHQERFISIRNAALHRRLFRRRHVADGGLHPPSAPKGQFGRTRGV